MIKKCQMCGNDFETASNRALYCSDCRKKRQVEKNNAYKKRKSEGLSREIGSTQICPVCGKEFILKTGSQKACEECQPKQAMSTKSKVNNRYTKSHYDRISVILPKGEREILKTYAESHGMSVNRVITSALEEYMKNHEEDTSNG